jgi:RNA polymerase sigma factor (sigma-70 family)
VADTDNDPDQRELRFHRLYRANFRPLQAYAVNRLGAADDVPDIVAEVFTTAWRRLAHIPPPPGDRFWLYGTARRVIARRHRSASRLHNLLGRLAAERRPAGLSLAWAPDPAQERLLAAVGRLKHADREALLLVHWEQLSYAEAAETLGCSVNAVGIRVHKAKARLRELLGTETGAGPLLSSSTRMELLMDLDLDTMLAEAAPARLMSLDGPDSPAAVSLYRRITGQPPAPSRASRRRRFAVPALTGAAVAGVTAALVAVAVVPGSAAKPDSPGAAAAAVLGHAALTAARQPAGAVAGPGQYIYVKAIEGQRYSTTSGGPHGKTVSGLCVQTVQDWVAPDGSGRQVASAPAASCGGYIPPQTFPKGQLIVGEVYPGAASLPAGPAALQQFIVAHFEGGAASVGATFQFAGTFLQSGAPPEVRAALYRMIESLPGVESLGPMTDKLGRHGAGVGFTQYGVRDVLIFDPATSAVLEREGIVADPSQVSIPPRSAPYSAGTVINYTVYQASGVANSITAMPIPPGGLPSPGA